ncbi:alpha/beta fold hydrolase [Deinococcus lacus]|uniref:Alpha/beta fold hydrolase n=1 Tax=Deinococcus lacus TaxID=392561 RepID=A0ABW1YCF4_9DEIO
MSLLHAFQSGEHNSAAVVFLHGAGLNARQWDAQLEYFASYFHCIAPDLPEHGGSTAFGPLTLAYSTHKLGELLSQIALDKPLHLVGHSFGASVGLHWLKREPKRFSSALVSGGAAGLSPSMASAARMSFGLTRLISQDKLVQASFRTFRIPCALQAKFERDMCRSVSPNFMNNLVTEMQRIELPDTSNPVLVLAGERETLSAKQAARQLAAKLPNAQAWTVPKVGHVWNLEQPDLFSKVLHDWLNCQEVYPPLRPLT